MLVIKTYPMKLLTLSALFLSAATLCSAQKLPSTQSGSLKAPANIKIDGKATEWGDKFKAYNKNIEAFYSITNDSQNLYLVVKANKHDIADKIIRGGVTLIINHTEKKNDPDAVAVTFPVLRDQDMSVVSNMFARVAYGEKAEDRLPIAQFNTILEARAKVIDLKGFKDIAETQISVYNEEGIKAVAAVDDKQAYVYELAIPLKYLALPDNGAKAFSYRVKLNEMPDTGRPPLGNGPPPPPMMITGLGTTDFWGVYTLAK